VPRVVIDQAIQIHFLSPNEMAQDLAPALESGIIFLGTTTSLDNGAERDVHVHVPWLGRRIVVRGRVLRRARDGEPPGLHIKLTDGPHGTIEELKDMVGRFRSGALLEETEDGRPPEQRLRAMSPQLRALLAGKANAEERLILARDPDPRVIEFLLKNPNLTLEEVRRLASRLTLNHGHFATISRNPAWMGDEMLRTTLARNPRLPEFLADMIMQVLSTGTLKNIVESINTTASTRRVATRILQTRGIVVSARKGTI
jgi:hypothetical protein